MKKRKIKTLGLKRKTISNLQEVLNGGLAASGALSCRPADPAPVTLIGQTGCRDTKHNWCDSRFGGCKSYYCPW